MANSKQEKPRGDARDTHAGLTITAGADTENDNNPVVATSFLNLALTKVRNLKGLGHAILGNFV